MADAEPDYSHLPLVERAVHKVWKVRKQAYEEAASEFAKSADESAACFTPWMMDPGLWGKVVVDSNVAAQQEGITAFCAFLEYGGPSACLRTRNQVISGLVEKGLSSAKAGTKQKSTEALLWLVELDTPGPVIELLVPYLSHKMAKIIAATLTALTAIYAAFGAKTVDPKPVLKVFPKMFGNTDKNVRAESTKLAIELYKWLKDAMKPMFFGELKPVQQKELEDAFEKVKNESPKQERLLRSQQAAAAAAEAAGEEPAEEEEEPEEVDAFDLAEPVDVIGKLPENFHDMIASSKWKDRKEALDALYAGLNVPRIKESDYGEIVRGLAKSMKDANVAVVTVAANCIEALANGLRKGFGRYKGQVLGPVLERLKEKKQSVVDALTKALDAIFNSTTLSECMEEILEMTKNKNPNVKLETLRFLTRALRTTRDVPTKPEQKAIAESATKLLGDPSAPLRDCAAEVMGTLMKIIGERGMNPYMEGLDDIRKTKIKEYFETAQVKAKEKPKPVAPPPAAKAPPKKILGGKAKPGMKAPVKKAAPPAAAPPPEEPPAPAPPKPAGRGIPSKLAGPKAGVGGLKLQKKPLGAGAGAGAAPAVASPKRASIKPPSPPVEEYEEEEPAAPPPPKSKLGLGRGLAGRPLSKEPAAPPPQPAVNPGLAAAEKAELDALRQEREQWIKQSFEERQEKSKLQQEINDLQLNNAQLIEEHTRDNLAIRAKEAQLVRARSDAEAAQEQVAKLQRENERLKRELQRQVRPTSPAPTDISEHLMNGGYAGESRSNSMSRSGHRLSYASTAHGSEDAENGHSSHTPKADRVMSPPLRSDSRASTATAGDGIESWKRAAEVTSQLKLRIEQMKAKQGLSSRAHTPRG